MAIRIQRILFPTDFSTISAAATKYACELTEQFDAELHLLHTIEPYPTPMPNFGIVPRYITELKTTAEKLLVDMIDSEWSVGRKVVRVVLEGSPKVEIVSYARKHLIDLIVIPTHGRTHHDPSHRLDAMIGSVAENVIRTAPCAALVVRPEGYPFVMP